MSRHKESETTKSAFLKEIKRLEKLETEIVPKDKKEFLKWLNQ